MKANQPVTMKLKKDDLVKVTSGAFKGKTGKVLAVHPRLQAVTIEGLGAYTRHIKPNQLNPKGGTREVVKPILASKVALIVDGKAKTSRIGYEMKKDTKVRIARQAGNKEIK